MTDTPTSARLDEGDVERIVRHDPWMMRVLESAESLGLPDWWIGAGFLRNKVWDEVEGVVTPSADRGDVDLVYFEDDATAPEVDWQHEAHLQERNPFAQWEVRNQARMHVLDGFEPYASTADGIAHWVETATCVAVRLQAGRLELLFCHGSADLLGLTARPIPAFRSPERIDVFRRRVTSKGWRERWSQLTVVDG